MLESETTMQLGTEEDNKENINPYALLKKKRLSKQSLKKALIESEKLKRSTLIAPPTSSVSNSLSSVSAFLQREKNSSSSSSAKNNEKKKGGDIRSKPWAKHLSPAELERILATKPRLSHDKQVDSKADSGVIIIKTQQCGRSDASKERIKAGILPKPIKNNLLELNRKLEGKIKEQSTDAWRERLANLKRPSKAKPIEDEEEQQVTDEDEADLMPKPDKNEIAEELLMRTEEAPSTCDEQLSTSNDELTNDEQEDNNEDEEENLLNDLLNEATTLNLDSSTQNLDSEKHSTLAQRQQKSITGFLSKDAAPVSNIPLFFEPTKDDEVMSEKEVDLKELKRKTKIKSFFFDEEAHTDDSESGDDDDSNPNKKNKKNKKKRYDDDESIDEAEIERELKASKFLVDEADADQNEDQIRATHTRLQLEADRAHIEKLTRKFNLSEESEYYEEEDGADDQVIGNKASSIWAGRIDSSDAHVDEDQLTDCMSEESLVRSEPEIEEEVQSSLRTEHRTALDDLLKLSSVMDVPEHKSKKQKTGRPLLPTSRTLIPPQQSRKEN